MTMIPKQFTIPGHSDEVASKTVYTITAKGNDMYDVAWEKNEYTGKAGSTDYRGDSIRASIRDGIWVPVVETKTVRKPICTAEVNGRKLVAYEVRDLEGLAWAVKRFMDAELALEAYKPDEEAVA